MSSPRTREILHLSLPIIGGMMSQNLLNLVDTWLIGGLGAAALAACGLANFMNFMAVAAITGLSTAVQAMAARRWRFPRPRRPRDCRSSPSVRVGAPARPRNTETPRPAPGR